ncbi:hypothetical protein [Streptomyces sp. NPDC056600]|uniref:hypothetical protein n=1 Tax=Streptomyces sp. NPDC056600 TaxID=3345874 RepID=UPI00367731F7
MLGAAVAVGVVLQVVGMSSEESAGGIRGLLALLLQGLGAGGIELRHEGGGMAMIVAGGYAVEISGVPFAAALLWLLGLWLAGRVTRARLAAGAATVPSPPSSATGGSVPAPGAPPRRAARRGGAVEAALRTGLLTAVGVLLLALFAGSGGSGELSVTVSPLRAALVALLAAVVVVAAVAGREELAGWRATRPGPDLLLRAGGTAVRAMAAVLALCGTVVAVLLLLALLDVDVLPGSGPGPGGDDAVVVLALLPNLAVYLLGLAWAVPVQWNGWMLVGEDQLGVRHTFGLSELADMGPGLAVGALVLGLLCAALIGWIVARRSTGPAEALLAGGLVLVLFLVPAACGTVTAELVEGAGFGDEFLHDIVRRRTLIHVGLDLGFAALLGILWVLGPAAVASRFARPRT